MNRSVRLKNDMMYFCKVHALGYRKPLLLLCIIPIFLVFQSCDVLDKDPVGMVTDDAVWSDPALIDAYTLDVYSEMELIGGYNFNSFNQHMNSSIGGEVSVQSWQAPFGISLQVFDDSGLPGLFQEWPYDNIRRANFIIEQLQGSAVELLDDDYIATRIAEMRFLRAFMYFKMVKRYGGVPLLTEVIDMDAPEEEIFVDRNSEHEIYDFIASEIDDIVTTNALPDVTPAAETGRATIGAALALKSRAMLYAASVAEFGDVQMNGLLGIPSNEALKYWQATYDASLAIIQSGTYELYNEHDDPVMNYRMLFLDDIPENTEAIFGELFDGEGKGHSNTFQSLPPDFALGWGSNNGVLYEMIELFDFIDGSSGRIPREQLTSQMWSSDELFGTRDPRFRASVYYPETTLGGNLVYMHSATIVNGEPVSSGNIEGWPAAGGTPLKNTGFLLRKRVNDNVQPTGHGTDDTDYIEFRLGEIYMNLVEAAYYLGEYSSALNYLNEIRNRAGMPEYDEVSEEIIRHERQVELAFEGHRYWDLRRWRIAEETLHGARLQGLRYDYDWDTQKYQIQFINAESGARVFQERHYYLPLGVGIVSENQNIDENPGY